MASKMDTPNQLSSATPIARKRKLSATIESKPTTKSASKKPQSGKKLKKILKKSHRDTSPVKVVRIQTDASKFSNDNNDDVKQNIISAMKLEEMSRKYPILKDHALIERFLKVPMNNNQKGRIRQAIKLQLQATSNLLYPEIIHGKMVSIVKSGRDLTDSDLRRIRILFNMLKTSLMEKPPAEGIDLVLKKKIGNIKEGQEMTSKGEIKNLQVKGQGVGLKGEKKIQKVKGPKRYVVFMGNLPLNVTKEKIMAVFSELNEQIVSVRIPKIAEDKKSAIAYVELANEPSYELALSKHHTMMGTKRINVLYTTQAKSKITKTAAKSKSAKMIALQKSGKLAGSLPLNKKRSYRRMIAKQAKAKQEKMAA